jgi:DNA polymerase III delta subunit
MGTLCLEVKTWNPAMLIAKRAAEIGLVVSCEASDPGKIPVWLQNDAKKRYAKKLTFGAAQMLAEYLGADFATLVSAIDTLALHAGDAPEIDETAVDALITRGHHEQVWDLARAASRRDTAHALELLDAFLADGMEAPPLVGLLRTEFRHLLCVKSLMRRMSVDVAMAQAAVPWPAQAGVREAVRGFSAEHLADAYQALVDADLDAKSGADPRIALETLVHRLCDPQAARGTRATAGGFSE